MSDTEDRVDTQLPISIAILAGGQSRRLGTDKALVRLRDDGPTLLEAVARIGRALSDDVFIVSENRPGYLAAGVRIRPDLYEEAGVLGGIASALRHAQHERCLVISCDHPFLNPELLREIASKAGFDVVVPAIAGESRQGGKLVRQTLHAVYGRNCVEPIERRLSEGKLQIVGFFDEVRVLEVPEADIRAIDPELRSFFSVNTPEALAEARAIARGD